MPIPEAKIKATLTRIATTAITTFAQQHRSEQFYGFAFDCNPDYCEVLLCLNTENALLEAAEQHKQSPPTSFLPKFDKMMEEKYGVKFKPLSHDKTVPEIVEALRWDIGSWKYHGFYNCNDDPEWAALVSDVSDACETDTNCEVFVESVCRVLPEIEAALAHLNRAGDFRSIVFDHDEDLESAWSRLQRLQSSDKP